MRRHGTASLFLCGLVSCAVLLVLGCGRKGPPRPPRAIRPPAVSDLRAEVEGRRIKLTWSVPEHGGEPLAGIESFTLFRFRTQNLDALCLDCPVDFRKFQEIDTDGKAIVDGSPRRVTAYDTMERGYGYMYKVVAFHESGGVGRDSNIVKVLP